LDGSNNGQLRRDRSWGSKLGGLDRRKSRKRTTCRGGKRYLPCTGKNICCRGPKFSKKKQRVHRKEGEKKIIAMPLRSHDKHAGAAFTGSD